MKRMYFRATMIAGNVNQQNTALWLWALASGALLVLFPSDASCLIATGALFLQQCVRPMPWEVILDGLSRCGLAFGPIALGRRNVCFRCVAVCGRRLGHRNGNPALPSAFRFARSGVDILILGGLFGLNHWISWDAGSSLTRNILILSVSIGLIAAGKHTAFQNLKTALVQLWMVLTIQCIVALLLSHETAWIYSGAYRFQGFQSNPNSLSHPFLILSIAVVLLCRTNRNDSSPFGLRPS